MAVLMKVIPVDGSKLTDICQVAGVHLFGTDDGEVLIYQNFLEPPRVNKQAPYGDSSSYQVNVPTEPPTKGEYHPVTMSATMEIETIVARGLRIGRTYVTYLGFGPKSKQWVFFGTHRRV